MFDNAKNNRHKPPTPTAMDLEIAANGGSTMPMRMSPEYLKASKYSSDIITKDELIRETGQLQAELAFKNDLNNASIGLLNGMLHAIEMLRSTLEAYKHEEEKIKNDYRDIMDDAMDEEDQVFF